MQLDQSRNLAGGHGLTMPPDEEAGWAAWAGGVSHPAQPSSATP